MASKWGGGGEGVGWGWDGGWGDVRCKKGRGGMLLEKIVWTCYNVVWFQ